jgi:hypothetical protein
LLIHSLFEKSENHNYKLIIATIFDTGVEKPGLPVILIEITEFPTPPWYVHCPRLSA